MNAPAPKREKPFIWVTWLSGVLSGSKVCKWAVWHRTHFDFNKTPEKDWTESNIRHTHIRSLLLNELEGRECEIYLEREVKIDRPNVTIKGAIDAVAVNDDRGVVFEVKSGKERASDKAQLMIYMWLLKRGYKRFNGVMLDGMLVYEDKRCKISALEINDNFSEALIGLVKGLIIQEPPRKYPSVDECRFCNIADCDERKVEPDVDEPSLLLPDFL